MTRLRTTKRGRPFASKLLERTPERATWAFLFQETGKPDGNQIVRLKIGRYKLARDGRTNIRDPESLDPKSEVQVQPQGLENLMQFLEENIRPSKEDKRVYVVVDDEDTAALVGQVKDLLNRRPSAEVLRLIEQHELLPEDIRRAVVARERQSAVDEFADALEREERESFWQAWLSRNDWVLGSDFVQVLDERTIDPQHQADYLARAIDGFMDVVEIKRPGMPLWNQALDRGNHVPHPELSKAVMQGLNYIYELEREMDSQKSRDRFSGVPIAKPRAVLICGRSRDWVQGQFLAQRLLNAALSGIQVFTYDQVLHRASRVLDRQAGRT